MTRCLVVGGSGALGKAVCERLAVAGVRVAFTFCRGEEIARALTRTYAAMEALHLDLRDASEIAAVTDEAARRLGGLDALVCVSAVGSPDRPGTPVNTGRTSDVDEAHWDHVMAVNLKGPFFVVQAAVPHLKRSGEGNIVLVGSVDGVKPIPSPIPYAASKAALDGMTRAIAKDLGRFRVRINTVHPGALEDGLVRETPPDLIAEYKKHCALKRLGRMDEVAAVIAWLVVENTYITGQSVVVDGGL